MIQVITNTDHDGKYFDHRDLCVDPVWVGELLHCSI